jgi:voltage-gated potassium channel
VERVDRRRLVVVVGALLVTLVGGTIGFAAILDESWHAALYRTIMSASLTGLDSTPRGPGAEALTVVIVLVGVTIFGYLAAQLVDTITRGVLGDARREKKRRKMIDALTDHIIVCGYGRVGRRVAEEFRTAGAAYVVLDYSEEALAAARQNDDLFVDGNGAIDEDLEKVGIDRARGLIVASDDDADNLYITLSAKSRRPELVVVARASSEDAERKLRLAGADRVVTPYTTAGRIMADLMIKPQVTAFVNVLTSASEPQLSIEELEVKAGCGASGRTIADLDRQTGAYIAAVRKHDGSFHTRPSAETLLEDADVVVGIGSPEEISRLEQLFGPQEALAR